MTKQIIFTETGSPDVLKLSDTDIGPINTGEIKINIVASGINYIDTYFRSGLYPVSSLPSSLGVEGAGIVAEVGADVTEFRVGDRVAFSHGKIGSYASEINFPAHKAVKVPDSIDLKTAASALLKGQTVEYLLNRTYPLSTKDTILFHAVAGGVGQIAVQWCKYIGATIIGTVGSEEKAEIAKNIGCDHIINSRTDNIREKVQEFTSGNGVDVVYDSVGKDTLEDSLHSLKKRGLLVSFGNTSGDPGAIDIKRLNSLGGLFLTRPSLKNYCSEYSENQESAKRVFSMIANGHIKIATNRTYPLEAAAQAHKDLEQRKSTGSNLLIP